MQEACFSLPVSLPLGQIDRWTTKQVSARRRAVVATLQPTTRVCKVCKQKYNPTENSPQSCRRHPGFYSGRLNRVEATDTSGLEYFWDCCGATAKDAPPCEAGLHRSYDE
jgi:hypothetical protein